MFCVIDREKSMSPIKSGFKTASQANNWCKKNLPKEQVHLWGQKAPWGVRYYVMQK